MNNAPLNYLLQFLKKRNSLLTNKLHFPSSPFIFILIAFLFFLKSEDAFATHSAGAELSYTWISGNNFEVKASFFRDCAGVAAPNSISLNVKSASCGKTIDFTLNKEAGPIQEITYPCYTVQTKCTNSSSPYLGYQKYVYSNIITLPQQCSDWNFNFFICCRNCAITTLNNPCNNNMYIEATLNNLIAPTNSSPKFTNVPVAFICINQTSTYNHGVIDLNGDSLVYSFISPRTYNTATSATGTVTYNPGFSFTSPLTSSPGATINSVNGDITMTPTVINEIGATAILVREYRNGVLIGSVIRDMQFITMNCNPNILPVASGINGTAQFTATACPGIPFSFTVNSSDANVADTVFMTWNSAITNATFTSSASTRPVGTFSWTPSIADARSQPYSFTVMVRDNACPTNGLQIVSFSIIVPTLTASVSSPQFNGYNVSCLSGGNGTATATPGGGTAPYSYSWNPSGQTTQTAVNLSAFAYIVTVTDSKGCTKTASISLTQPPSSLSSSLSATTNVSCNGGNNGSSTISGSGGIGPYTYLWTPSAQTTATATSLSSLSYTAKVTDQNGCTSQQSILISQPTVLNASISSFQNVSCQGNANGSIQTSFSGGTAPYNHRWSNGDTTANISGLAPGVYSDTIRDSKGCTKIISQAISQPGSAVSIPGSSLSATNVSCYGGNNGTANIFPSGGTLPYTVTWSNGDIGNSADSLSKGSYRVQIADGNGCTFDTTIQISEPLILTSVFSGVSMAPSGHNIRCNGDTTGKAKVLPSGGTIPYSFLWSNSVTVDSINNVPAGTYSVVITDNNGCTFSDTIILTEPTILNDSLVFRNVGCKGEPSGGVRAVTYGGATSYSYVWSNGPVVIDTVGDLQAGFYQVTITDTNNCQVTDTITIQEPDTLVPLILPSTFIGATNVKCFGDSSGNAVVNVFGGTPPFTYLWSQNSVDSFATNLKAGLISVRVVDSNGCSIIRNKMLTEPLPFSYNPIAHNPDCYGDSSGYIVLNTSGNTTPYSFNWSNAMTTDSIGGLFSGTYYVIINDANNCMDSSGFILSDYDSLIANATVSDYLGYNVHCISGTDGYIALHPSGGVGGYSYLWSNSSITDSISGLTGTPFSVSLFDTHGCRLDTSFNLTQPTQVSPVLSYSLYNSGVNISCYGYVDGHAYAVVSGGVPPYQYLWSNGDAVDSAYGLNAGSHSLTVTDSNGCSTSVPFTLNEPSPLAVLTVLSNYNGYNFSCSGDSSGCITLNTSGGNSPYHFIWNIQDTINTSFVCNLSEDTVLVSIVDANGCKIDTSFILTTPPKITDSAVLSNYNGYEIQCNGLSNGNIDITVNGGVAPLNFAWSNSMSTEDLSNIPAGNYTLIIMDANTCSDTLSFILSEPPAISNSISMVSSTCQLNNGSAQVIITGGLSPFTFLWTASGQTTATATNLSGGLHTVTISDSLGCTKSDTITVNIIPGLILNFSGLVNNFCRDSTTGSVQVNVSGGAIPYSYLWANGDTTFIAKNLAEGFIRVEVTDFNGCNEIDSIKIINVTDCALQLPTAYSPNNDGYNDTYQIKGLSLYPENSVKVYNRWGNEVFSKENYKNTDWYGQNNSGNELPDGTYFVTFESMNPAISVKTYVEIQR